MDMTGVGRPLGQPQSGENRVLGKIKFDSSQVIGKGCRETVVYRGNFEGRPVAVKRIRSEYFSLAVREAELLKLSDGHSNIIRYHCTETDGTYSYIALDLCEATLGDWVEGRYKDNNVDGIQVLRQASEGLGHLHSLNIVHRDLKPANILLRLLEGNEVRTVISDFGFSKKLKDEKESFSMGSGLRGTEGWVAPEVMRKMSTDDRNVSLTIAVDVFSMGCVFYYVLTYMTGNKGLHPFGENPFLWQGNIYKDEKDLSKLTEDSRGTCNLIRMMLKQEPKMRPPIQAVLQHPMFWSDQKILAFFTDISNRIAIKSADGFPLLKRFEEGGGVVVGRDWTSIIHSKVLAQLNKHRKYKGNSVRDLLRAVRNCGNHFHEMGPEFKEALGGTSVKSTEYWTKIFPALLPYTWESFEGLKDEEDFGKYYPPNFNFADGKDFDILNMSISNNLISQDSCNPAAGQPGTTNSTGETQVNEPIIPSTIEIENGGDPESNYDEEANKTFLDEIFALRKVSARWEYSEISASPLRVQSVCTIATARGDIKIKTVGESKEDAEYLVGIEVLSRTLYRHPKAIINDSRNALRPTWSYAQVSKTPPKFISICTVTDSLGEVFTGNGEGPTTKIAEHDATVQIFPKVFTSRELAFMMNDFEALLSA